MIAQPLRGLLRYAHFITYKLVPSESRPGKFDKIPTDHRSGKPHNALDPLIWTEYDIAHRASGGLVGFVLNEHNPYFCLDIDNCLVDGKWSQLAIELCGRFPGAALEPSVSGTGLHIWGLYQNGKMPRHKSKANGLELYHQNRFIALGIGTHAVGDANTDCTQWLPSVIERYFSADTSMPETTSVWTTSPVQEWIGPTDDDELIRRGCISRSAESIFGTKTSFKQLWDADAESLGKSYPDSYGSRSYDASSADAALAQHLAFWTGKNCERIHTLMRRSHLVRDKWNRDGDDYLKRTILSAVARQTVVCQDKPVDLTSRTTIITESKPIVGSRILSPQQQADFFKGFCYVVSLNRIVTPIGLTLNQDTFDATYGNYSFIMDNTNTKVADSAWKAYLKSQAIDHPRAEMASFYPDRPPMDIWMIGNKRHLNTYRPIEVPSKKGNPQPFLDHIAKILPAFEDRSILIAYMAAIVQHKGVKFQWCVLIQGVEGNGKSLLSECVINAIGKDHCYSPKASELTARFNSWIENRIFIEVQDIYVPKEKIEVLETLKPMITSNWLEVEGKGKDKETKHICANFILNSNHKDALKKTENDRRFAIFFCKQQTFSDLKRDGMEGDYFPRLYAWLRRDGFAIVTDYLQNYKIPDVLNPAKDCHRAPTTTSTDEAIEYSASPIEQEIVNAINEDRVGFRAGWISSHYLTLLIKDIGARISPHRRGEIIAAMGYVTHPGLNRGQCSNIVRPDMMKPRLYVKEGHPSLMLKAGAVSNRYSLDQGVTMTPLELSGVPDGFKKLSEGKAPF